MNFPTTLRFYFRIWRREAALSWSTTFSRKIDGVSYWVGKLLRFLFFCLLLVSLFNHTRDFLGYSMAELVLIFLTFNLIDTLSQILFRGLYGFSAEITRGLFDFTLIRPANSLFLVMTRVVDILDVLFLIPLLIGYVLVLSYVTVTWSGILLFLLLIITGTIIATALHIMMASYAIVARSDNMVMIFRSLGRFAMFPQETYNTVLRYFLIFGVPVLTMMVFPGQALMGKLDTVWVFVAVGLSGIFFAISLCVWSFCVRRYSSASS
jgi:ABC-type uncharacterized transport system permease subunit